MKMQSIADCVLKLILKGEKELGYFSLPAFVIMPNHVHLLMTPRIPLPRLMNGLKGATAFAANAILNRRGQPFWQDESFDHWVRTEKEFGSIFDTSKGTPFLRAWLVDRRIGCGPALEQALFNLFLEFGEEV